jgi:hypothetical protein
LNPARKTPQRFARDLHRRGNISLCKVIADIEQRAAILLCDIVSEAIAKVEAGRMASLAPT